MAKQTENTPQSKGSITIFAELGCVILTLAFVILATVWLIFPALQR